MVVVYAQVAMSVENILITELIHELIQYSASEMRLEPTRIALISKILSEG